MTTSIASDDFIDLMCADTGLLRAEFDAIMAAEFPRRRRRPPARRSSGADRRDGHTGQPGTTVAPAIRSPRPDSRAVAARARERSPPDTTPRS